MERRPASRLHRPHPALAWYADALCWCLLCHGGPKLAQVGRHELLVRKRRQEGIALVTANFFLRGMGFFGELFDKVASVFDSDEDEEAAAAQRRAEAQEKAEQKLVDEGLAVVLRVHGPYPRNPLAEDCPDWIASGRCSCAEFDQHSRCLGTDLADATLPNPIRLPGVCSCDYDHKPEAFVSGTRQTVADSITFVLPTDNVTRTAFRAIGANDKDHVMVTHGVAGEDIQATEPIANTMTFADIIPKAGFDNLINMFPLLKTPQSPSRTQ